MADRRFEMGPELRRVLHPPYIARQWGEIEERLQSIWDRLEREPVSEDMTQRVYFALDEARRRREYYESLPYFGAIR